MDNADMPANPVFDSEGVLLDGLPEQQCTGGLTKREELAARAMQGLLSDPNVNPDGIFELSVMCADHLLAELDKGRDQ